jgi:thiamine biosynthesis protein ThiC
MLNRRKIIKKESIVPIKTGPIYIALKTSNISLEKLLK